MIMFIVSITIMCLIPLSDKVELISYSNEQQFVSPYIGNSTQNRVLPIAATLLLTAFNGK